MKKIFLLFLLPLFAFSVAHKFYISVTHIGYSEKDNALQIKSRFFIDDMNAVIEERYGIDAQLGEDNESKITQEYLEKYIRTKISITINDTIVAYTILGKKYDNDVILLYLEVPNVAIDEVSTIGIENEILTDLYDEQQNVVHFKINDKKKSFVLLKSDTKGMLNL